MRHGLGAGGPDRKRHNPSPNGTAGLAPSGRGATRRCRSSSSGCTCCRGSIRPATTIMSSKSLFSRAWSTSPRCLRASPRSAPATRRCARSSSNAGRAGAACAAVAAAIRADQAQALPRGQAGRNDPARGAQARAISVRSGARTAAEGHAAVVRQNQPRAGGQRPSPRHRRLVAAAVLGRARRALCRRAQEERGGTAFARLPVSRLCAVAAKLGADAGGEGAARLLADPARRRHHAAAADRPATAGGLERSRRPSLSRILQGPVGRSPGAEPGPGRHAPS